MCAAHCRIGVVFLMLLMNGTSAMAASPYAPAYPPYQPPPSSFPSPNDWTGNVNLFGGGKFLNCGDWAPADQQLEYGVEIDARRRFWPMNLALDVLYGTDSDSSEGITFKSRILEFDAGLRKIFDQFPPPLRPYFGLGVAVTRAEASAAGYGSDSGTGPGVWAQGGVYLTFAGHFNLGADFRVSQTWVDIAGATVDGGGLHIGLVSGYHW